MIGGGPFTLAGFVVGFAASAVLAGTAAYNHWIADPANRKNAA